MNGEFGRAGIRCEDETALPVYQSKDAKESIRIVMCRAHIPSGGTRIAHPTRRTIAIIKAMLLTK